MLTEREVNTVWFWNVSAAIRGRIATRKPLTYEDAILHIRTISDEVMFSNSKLYNRSQELMNEVIYDTIGEKRIPESAKIIELAQKRYKA